MDIEIANNLLNKDGIQICVLVSDIKADMILRSRIYNRIDQDLFVIKNRQCAKLKNESVIYFINVNSGISVLRGKRFNKVYCDEILPKEVVQLWYSEIALCIEPMGIKPDKVWIDEIGTI